MGLSFWHILVVLVVVLIVFGAGRLPQVMGDLGKGIRSFKDGMSGEAGGDSKRAESGDEKPKTLPPSSKES